MADYKDIVGTAVRNNAGNLSAGQKDQIFYDSTNVDFKYQLKLYQSAWRTSAPMNTAKLNVRGYLVELKHLLWLLVVKITQGPIFFQLLDTESWNGTHGLKYQ